MVAFSKARLFERYITLVDTQFWVKLSQYEEREKLIHDSLRETLHMFQTLFSQAVRVLSLLDYGSNILEKLLQDHLDRWLGKLVTNGMDEALSRQIKLLATTSSHSFLTHHNVNLYRMTDQDYVKSILDAIKDAQLEFQYGLRFESLIQLLLFVEPIKWSESEQTVGFGIPSMGRKKCCKHPIIECYR